MTEPLKILCIHGYRQNGASFKQKLGAFRKAVGKRAEFVFIDAPHVVPKKTTDSEESTNEERGWWFSANEDDFMSFNALETSEICPGFDDSVAAIHDALNTLGPFDGILGFSQGAAMVGLYLATLEDVPSQFKFAMFVASFKSKSSKHYQFYNESHKIPIPSLHVMGETDAVIPMTMSEEYLCTFVEPQTLVHGGGHFLPTAGPQKKIFNSFLDDMREKLNLT